MDAFDVRANYAKGRLTIEVNGTPLPQDFASVHIFANGGFGQPPGYRLELGATAEEPDGGSEKKTAEDARKDLKSHSYL